MSSTRISAPVRGACRKAVVAEIDADMRKSAAHGIEEHEVAGLQFVAVDHRTDLALLSRAARQQDADRFLENDLDKAAAVETGIGIGTAEAVVDADQFEALEDQILRAVAVALEQRRFFDRKRQLRWRGPDRTMTWRSGRR
jgi:hypothetical protein